VRALATLFAFIAFACSSDPDDGGPDPGDEGPAILERTPRSSHTCTVESDVEVVAQNRNRSGIALAQAGERTFAASPTSSVEALEPGFTVSELLFDPVELATPAHEVLGLQYPRRPALVESDGALGLSWVESTGQLNDDQLHFVVLDSAGELTGGPIQIANDGLVRVHTSAAWADGFALLWSDDAGLSLLLVDQTSAPVGEPIQIAAGDIRSAHLARHGNGLAAAWVDDDGVHASVYNQAGGRLGGPTLLSAPLREDERLQDAFVAAVGDQLLAAWTETYRDSESFDPLDGRAIVRLVRLDSDGEPLGPAERLQDPEDGIDAMLNSLLPVDGKLAVSWTRGSYIPVCAGCVSDATMGFVLLDPADRVPVSDQVELTGPSGLEGAPMIADSGDVTFFLTVDYHALTDLAAAKVRCVAR
jgi:hypothetical protein